MQCWARPSATMITRPYPTWFLKERFNSHNARSLGYLKHNTTGTFWLNNNLFEGGKTVQSTNVYLQTGKEALSAPSVITGYHILGIFPPPPPPKVIQYWVAFYKLLINYKC
jgi:hypothetical protein